MTARRPSTIPAGFVSEEFDLIDADKNGALTSRELSNSVFVRGQQKQPGGTHK